MMVLVTYDVKTDSTGGAGRLRNVAKACKDYGQRAQYSIFECVVDPAQWVTLKAKLESIIDPEVDSLRYYFLGSNWKNRIEHIGAKKTYDPDKAMIF